MTTAHTHDHDHDHPHTHPQAASEMRGAALALLNSLDAAQKAAISYSYHDGERIFWYYPPLNRHGLMLRDMSEEQRGLAYALMATGLTEDSNRQARLIIEHEDVLGPLEQEAGRVTFLRDTLWYAWTIFGDPASDAEPWGWRVEGHHVSLHYSIWGDRVLSVTPFFFGANPGGGAQGTEAGPPHPGRQPGHRPGTDGEPGRRTEGPGDHLRRGAGGHHYLQLLQSVAAQGGRTAGHRHVGHAAGDADGAGQRVRDAGSAATWPKSG